MSQREKSSVLLLALTVALACGSSDVRAQPFEAGGVVTDASGRPVPGAVVRAYSCGDGRCSVVATATANGSGRFVIAPVGRNPFVLEASATGFQTGYWNSSSATSPEAAARLTIDRSRSDLEIHLPSR